MKFITNKLHGFLDFLTVIAFLVIPVSFGLTGTPSYLSYILAVVHLILTLLTDFQYGIIKKIPLSIHRTIEAIVGPALILAPWLLGFSENFNAKCVYLAMGIVVMAVGFLSDYAAENIV